MAAVDAGVMHFQGTLNEYGERTGNANFGHGAVEPAAEVRLAAGSPHALAEATRIAHAVAVSPMCAEQSTALRGGFGVRAQGGLHASAIKVDANLYQHIDPMLVGNDMRMLVSDMAGRANIQLKAPSWATTLSNRDLAAR